MSAIKLPTPEDMTRFAAQLAGLARAGDCIALEGDLGAGKTTFARGFIRALCGEETEVASPTFTLLQTYTAPQATIWHVDLYRLESAEELRELGLEEAFENGIALIEWPQIAQAELPEATLHLRFTIEADETRIVDCKAGAAWYGRLQSIGL